MWSDKYDCCVSDMECTNCTVVDVDVSSTKPKARNAKGRTMFKLQPLEGGKFKLERESLALQR